MSKDLKVSFPRISPSNFTDHFSLKLKVNIHLIAYSNGSAQLWCWSADLHSMFWTPSQNIESQAGHQYGQWLKTLNCKAWSPFKGPEDSSSHTESNPHTGTSIYIHRWLTPLSYHRINYQHFCSWSDGSFNCLQSSIENSRSKMLFVAFLYVFF